MPLLTTFAGPSKSSGGFNPASISGLTLWLDASAGSTLNQASDGSGSAASADNDPIGRWADRSGNNRHVSQATSAQRPTLDLAQINGLQAVRFDGGAGGNTQSLGSVAISDIAATNAHTVFIVFKVDSVASLRRVFANAASSQFRLDVAQTTGIITHTVFQTSGSTGVAVSVTPAAATGVVNLVCCRHVSTDGTTGTLAISNFGGLETTLNCGDITRTDVVHFPAPNGSDKLPGLIGEVLVYNVNLSTASRNLIGQYLATKWGVAWTPMS